MIDQQAISEREIFNVAVRLSAEDRADYLVQACGDNQQLRAEVKSLLSAHEASDSFMDGPALELPSDAFTDTTDDEPLTEGPSTVIGPYKLLQRIGEGGMGVVFMAEQTRPVQRTVALKIIKPGMDTRQVIARFEAERQALAMMDHPNIARVLDAGTTETGRPYFVMDLVKGVPIIDYCDDHHLSIHQRLELFTQICHAVQHAHQKGVIHRDLKPSNVLVAEYDGLPVPKVIDFGVAKATEKRLTERTMFTQYGQIIGTFEYMSPEQASFNQLDVDTRSDIYSLGVLLYELLTGSTPLERKRLHESALDEALRIIREEEPPSPSLRVTTLAQQAYVTITEQRSTDRQRLRGALRGELDWIVMKCLDKDRSRRYQAASSVAQDVQRYLNDEAVEACSPSVAYRVRKFARRNKPMLATAAVIAASLMLGIVVSFWQAQRALKAERLATQRLEAEKLAHQEADRQQRAARDAQSLAQNNAEEAIAQRRRAEANLLKAREAVDQMLTRVGADSLDSVPHMQPVQRALLKDALKFYQGFLDQDSEDRELRLETAQAWRRVGMIHRELGQFAKSQQAQQKSIAMLEKLVDEFPTEATYRAALAASYERLGYLFCWDLSDQYGAALMFGKALTLEEALVREFPSQPEYRAPLSSMTQGMGLALQYRGRIEEAETALRGAVEISIELAKDDPNHRGQLARRYLFLGILLSESKKTGEAEAAFRNALAIFQQMESESALARWDRLHVQGINRYLAKLAHQAGSIREAELLYRSALSEAEILVADFPDIPFSYGKLSEVEMDLARLLTEQHRNSEAEQLYRHALERSAKLAADHADMAEYRHRLAWKHYMLAEFLRDMDRQVEAAHASKEALRVCEKLVALFPDNASFHEQWIYVRLQLIELLKATGQVSEIEQVQEQTLGVYKSLGKALAWTHEELLKSIDIAYRNSLKGVDEPRLRLQADQDYQSSLKGAIEWHLARLDQLTEAEPANWVHWLAHGRLKLRLEKWDEATANFAKAAELQGDNEPGCFHAGWWVVGPYPVTLTESLPPEQDPDPFSPVPSVKETGNDAANLLHWLPAYPDSSGRLDIAAHLTISQPAIAYVLTHVYSRKNQDVAFALSADVELRLWLNGTPIRQFRRDGSAVSDLERVSLTLRAGWNTLLVKVVNTTPLEHGLYLRISERLKEPSRTNVTTIN